jgi:hypothetical protein
MPWYDNNNNKDDNSHDNSSCCSSWSGLSDPLPFVFDHNFEIVNSSPGRNRKRKEISSNLVVSLSIDDDDDDASTDIIDLTQGPIIDLLSDESSTDHSTLSDSSWHRSKLRKSQR